MTSSTASATPQPRHSPVGARRCPLRACALPCCWPPPGPPSCLPLLLPAPWPAGMEMQGGVLVARKERGGFGLATFATGIVYGLQVHQAVTAASHAVVCAVTRVAQWRAVYSRRGTSQMVHAVQGVVHVGAHRGFRWHRTRHPPLTVPQPDALFVIVPALALPTKLAAAAYILMFVLGTVAAMGAYTGVIGERP